YRSRNCVSYRALTGKQLTKGLTRQANDSNIGIDSITGRTTQTSFSYRILLDDMHADYRLSRRNVRGNGQALAAALDVHHNWFSPVTPDVLNQLLRAFNRLTPDCEHSFATLKTGGSCGTSRAHVRNFNGDIAVVRNEVERARGF